MRRFFIADTHFGHENIIKYCNRPFKSTTEMNRVLIDNWNRTVKDEDIVWMLGDFAFGSKDYIKSITSQLNGRKKLILGNHDRHKIPFYEECGFNFVSRYPILVDKTIILSHAPIEFLNENCPFFNIHGHVHDNPAFSDISKTSACVSVERINYKPIEFEELKRKWKD